MSSERTRLATRQASPGRAAAGTSPLRSPAQPAAFGVTWQGVGGDDAADTGSAPIDGRSGPRVLIVAEHASAAFGGEAILPLHYFRVLRARGIPAWLVVHERTRAELLGRFPRDADRIRFVRDTRLHRVAWALHQLLPERIARVIFGLPLRMLTQLTARRLARQLIAEHQIEVVHQPIPVSPREPSALLRMGAPVVIGPMNGGMDYPPGFGSPEGRIVQAFVASARALSRLVNRLIPGKRNAAVLLVANGRTRQALPAALRRRAVELVENGVDAHLWTPREPIADTTQPVRFVFLGRLVDWKAVDVLLHALHALGGRACGSAAVELEIIGDGPMRSVWTELAARLGLASRVSFVGWLPQSEAAQRLRRADVLLLPSLYECGGAVVLEAMCCAVPVIATAWGGPQDYLDHSCGILIAPVDREQLATDFSSAMARLAGSPSLRARMGAAGRTRALALYDWERKVDRILEVYDLAREEELGAD